MRMAENSLFGILLRSRWWISIAIAVFIGLVAAASLTGPYRAYGAFTGAPFFIIGIIAAWRQARIPSPARVTEVLRSAGAMSWNDFSGCLERAFQRDGYEVTRLPGPHADLSVTRNGRTMVVGCRRWKAARNGIEPLRDLHGAMLALGAQECAYAMTGEITEQAQRFADERKIRLLRDAELARLLIKGRSL